LKDEDVLYTTWHVCGLKDEDVPYTTCHVCGLKDEDVPYNKPVICWMETKMSTNVNYENNAVTGNGRMRHACR